MTQKISYLFCQTIRQLLPQERILFHLLKKGNMTVKQATTGNPNFSIWGECQSENNLYITSDRSNDINSRLTISQFFKNRAFPVHFFQSLSSGIPLPQPIIMMPFSIHQNSPSVVPSTPKCQSKKKVPV